ITSHPVLLSDEVIRRRRIAEESKDPYYWNNASLAPFLQTIHSKTTALNALTTVPHIWSAVSSYRRVTRLCPAGACTTIASRASLLIPPGWPSRYALQPG